ncbi:MAG: hypothetical protein A3E82_02015 [Gammaproteobacteria bacterium RIFCSPHIGHO2_12_FULL_38_11]|nr:MAG: hypothetical protein A3E82_02015 [Gammaproteobacteria bacterium RIFCSPHIGHO2_12_FULL_38_11]
MSAEKITINKTGFQILLTQNRNDSEVLDLSNYAFDFSDFSRLDLTNCQFWSLPAEPVAPSVPEESDKRLPPESASNSWANLESNTHIKAYNEKFSSERQQRLAPNTTQHAVFLQQADFSGATHLSADAFFSPAENKDSALRNDVVLCMFPAGYQNDNGLLTAVFIEECMATIRKNGLNEKQMGDVTEHMIVDVPAVKKTHTVMKVQDGEFPKLVRFTLHEANKRAVLNIENTFSTGDKLYSAGFPDAIKSEELNAVFKALGTELKTENEANSNVKKMDCIQMPMKIEWSGRNHYVQVQIYKNNKNEIAARIVDSTANPIGMGAAKVAVSKMLDNNKWEIFPLLGITETAVVAPVSIAHTGVQSSISIFDDTDTGCGVYTMASMLATTREVLLEGADILNNDTCVKQIITAEHVAAKENSTYLQDNCEHRCVIKKTPDVNKTTSELLDDKLNAMDKNTLVNAVEIALKTYQKNINAYCGFFKKFHSQGDAYVALQLVKLNNEKNPEREKLIAKKIAKEILSDGLMRKKNSVLGGETDDPGALKVINTRMACLLKAFQNENLISKNVDVSKSSGLIKFDELFNSTETLLEGCVRSSRQAI